MLLRSYAFLSGLFYATVSAKVYEAADEAELKTLENNENNVDLTAV